MERTHNQPEKDRRPRESRVISEPADVQHCRDDYAAGKDVRERAAEEWTTGHRHGGGR
ncbi:hypothetical protein ABZ442_04960 [Streptomyces triculaminicus]|uniref:hypothetical protein n=1 Tax=Streptomyces triculaminicus TaxID=2816232 RepID=UPI0034103333